MQHNHLGKDIKSMTLPAIRANQEIMSDAIMDMLCAHDCPAKTISEVMVAFDELISNIVNYAYKDGQGDMRIDFSIGGEVPTLTLDFIDKGIPFDPLKKPDPDITLSVEDREIGNLGIFMVKQMMTSIEYERVGDENHLRITKMFEK